MSRLTEYGTLDRTQTTEALDDVLGLELSITSAELREGNYGEYITFDAVDTRGRTHTVSTGAFLVVDALRDVIQKQAFPVEARFVKRGRTYRFE